MKMEKVCTLIIVGCFRFFLIIIIVVVVFVVDMICRVLVICEKKMIVFDDTMMMDAQISLLFYCLQKSWYRFLAS